MSKKLIFIIIALLIVVGVGYFVYQSSTPNYQQKSASGEIYNNLVYSYSLNLPESWKGKYLIEERDNTTSFIYNPSSGTKYNLFSIVVYPNSEWQQLKSEPGFHGTEIIKKDDLVFVYVISLDNPYTGNEGDEYERMAGEINSIIKTFEIK